MDSVLSPEHARELSAVNRRQISESNILFSHTVLLEDAINKGETSFSCSPIIKSIEGSPYKEWIVDEDTFIKGTTLDRLHHICKNRDLGFYKSIKALAELGYTIDLSIFKGERLKRFYYKLAKDPVVTVSFDK